MSQSFYREKIYKLKLIVKPFATRMNTLQLPHAKLLYYITELFKQDSVTEDQKIKLKEKVISSDEKIFTILEEWEEKGDEGKLRSSILELVS
jgi:hypothetical protein